jgi:hypothetical protein
MTKLELRITWEKGDDGKTEFLVSAKGGDTPFFSSSQVEETVKYLSHRIRWLLHRITNERSGDGNSFVISARQMATLQVDGIKEANPEEWQSFIRALIHTGGYSGHYGLGITIPVPVRAAMRLKRGDKLLIAIKRPSKQEIAEYVKLI